MLKTGSLMMVGLIWAGSGFSLIAAPTAFTASVQRALYRPTHRFLLAQAAMLVGLVLLLGTAGHEASWLWVAIGGIAILKGMFFLGASDRLRDLVLKWWCQLPSWSQQLSGLLAVALAVWLMIDAIRAFM